jgi:hypothetical protein
MSVMSYPFVDRMVLSLVLGVAVAWTTGCRGEKQPPASAAQGGDATAPAGLAELSPQDREHALKQKVCPVSGYVLGEMGAPIKLTVKGHDVFICCPSCEEPLMEDPDQYLAELGLDPRTR